MITFFITLDGRMAHPRHCFGATAFPRCNYQLTPNTQYQKQLTLGFIFCYSFKPFKQINCNSMYNNKSSLVSNWNRSLGINKGDSPKTFFSNHQHWYSSTSQNSEKSKRRRCFWIFKYDLFKLLFQCRFKLDSCYTWK